MNDLESLSDTTLIISTFERPACLDALVGSIREFYPSIPILIADDSASPRTVDGCKVFALPYDSGLSVKRNVLLSHVETKYFVTLDDDFLFTADTKLERLRDLMSDWDIVGGNAGSDYIGRLVREGNTLRCETGTHPDGGVDIVPNFFMADTKKIRGVRWREELKLGEHLDFFLRGISLRVKYVEDVRILNTQGGSEAFRRMRKRGLHYKHLFMKLHGLESIVSFDGSVVTPTELKRQYEEYEAWAKRRDEASVSVQKVVPEGERYILVDDDRLGCSPVEGRHAVPFVERDGQSWGCPEDDQSAIRELIRGTQRGIRFVVFAFPSFWWLDHYAELHRYLKDYYSCILANEAVVVFTSDRAECAGAF